MCGVVCVSGCMCVLCEDLGGVCLGVGVVGEGLVCMVWCICLGVYVCGGLRIWGMCVVCGEMGMVGVCVCGVCVCPLGLQPLEQRSGEGALGSCRTPLLQVWLRPFSSEGAAST